MIIYQAFYTNLMTNTYKEFDNIGRRREGLCTFSEFEIGSDHQATVSMHTRV